ncbi:hypothetical protein U91I_02253 [alpha proteobacterium U9-1i]|nr:hypothetical protein U91I_02253 [alpha proteobacterium U9-1i]
MQSQFLSRVLLADALVSGVAGLMMILAAPLLAPLLNLPASLLQLAGVSLLPWFLALVALSRQAQVSRGALMWVVAVNAIWVLGSVAVLFVWSPSAFGYAFIIVQAVAVGVFAELQMVALKRMGLTA